MLYSPPVVQLVIVQVDILFGPSLFYTQSTLLNLKEFFESLYLVLWDKSASANPHDKHFPATYPTPDGGFALAEKLSRFFWAAGIGYGINLDSYPSH